MGLDDAVHDAVAGPPWTALLPLAQALAVAGSVYGWWVLVGLLALRRRWALALPLAAALLLADATAFALKPLVARARPPDALFVDSLFSFPSGHTLRAAAAAGVAWLADLPRPWKVAAAGLALAMAASRVLARAHWPSDVLASLALGLALGVAVALAWRADAARLRTGLLARLPTARG